MKIKHTQIIMIILISSFLMLGCTHTQITNDNIGSVNKNNKLDIEDGDTYKDVSILGITFGTKYQDVVDMLGEPIKIIPIKDEMTIVDKGYYSLLEYKDYEVVVYDNENFQVSPDCIIVEIDAIDEEYVTSKGIHIGSTIEDVMNEYGLKKEEIYDKSNEEIICNMRITGLRVDTSKFVDYDKYCFITKEDDPRALIFLFEDSKVVRILIRHLTAD
ncbi:MAG: hypothetical protein PWP51_2770 [Clostridiales bacterium]|jgi:hypothetical protein|nr:hypothetical protein [Clostridiales bacterium]